MFPFPDGQDRCNETWDGLKRTIYGAFTNVTQVNILPVKKKSKSSICYLHSSKFLLKKIKFIYI